MIIPNIWRNKKVPNHQPVMAFGGDHYLKWRSPWLWISDAIMIGRGRQAIYLIFLEYYSQCNLHILELATDDYSASLSSRRNGFVQNPLQHATTVQAPTRAQHATLCMPIHGLVHFEGTLPNGQSPVTLHRSAKPSKWAPRRNIWRYVYIYTIHI